MSDLLKNIATLNEAQILLTVLRNISSDDKMILINYFYPTLRIVDILLISAITCQLLSSSNEEVSIESADMYHNCLGCFCDKVFVICN